jgi:hypothetical protein
MSLGILALQRVLISNSKLVHLDVQTNCIGEECGRSLLFAVTERKRLGVPVERFYVDSTLPYELFKVLWHDSKGGKKKGKKKKGGKKKKKKK